MISNDKIKEKILEMALNGELIKNDSSLITNKLPGEIECLPYSLPKNWKWVKYKNFADSKMGKTILSSELTESGIPVYSATQGDNIFGFVKKSDLILNKGDIVIPARGNSIGHVTLIKDDIATCTQTTIFSKIDSENVDSKYLVYCCRRFRSTWFKSSGAAIPQVTVKQINEILVPIPPLEEQKRIVKKIDELFELIDRKEKNDLEKEKLKSILKERILESSIKKISSDNLNEYPYCIPDNWNWKKLNDITIKIVDGDHNPPKGENDSTDYFMLSAINISDDELNETSNIRYLSKNNFELSSKRTSVEKGDILLSIVGTIGKCCIFNSDSNITFQRSVSVIKPSKDILNKYLLYCLKSPFIQKFMNDNSAGAVQRGFYLKQLKELLIPLPSLEEQKKIVEKIEQCFELIEQL